MRTFDGFSKHRSSRNAALIAHFGFLSIFPLVLAMTTVLGFVLHGRPDLQEKIIDSSLAQIPIVGPTIGTNPSALQGSTPVLIFGLVAALWSGLRAFVAIQVALDDVCEVPWERRPGYPAMRGRALIGVGVIGGSQIATAVVTGIASAGSFTIVNRGLLVGGVLAINVAALILTFRYLCSAATRWVPVVPGACAAGVAFSTMQIVGTTVVARLIANASPVYGTFASVIALLTWLSLHANVGLIAAEFNEVLRQRRLSPDPGAAPQASTG